MRPQALFRLALLITIMAIVYTTSVGTHPAVLVINESNLEQLGEGYFARCSKIASDLGTGLPAGGIKIVSKAPFWGAYLRSRDMIIVSETILADNKLFDFVIAHELSHRHDFLFDIAGRIFISLILTVYIIMLVSTISMINTTVRKEHKIRLSVFYLFCLVGALITASPLLLYSNAQLFQEIYCNYVAYRYTGFGLSIILIEATTVALLLFLFVVCLATFRRLCKK